MTTVMKQKEDDEPPKIHGSTLFVSNLPYSATSVDLQTLFSDIAPVRSAFVVTEHGTGVSKGVGYVSFALKEDADAAFRTISQSGIELVGRKLRIQWAESKKLHETGENEKVLNPKPVKQRSTRMLARLPHDPAAIRTIIISGLPQSIDSKVLWKKIRKYDGAETVEWPVKSESKEGSSSIALVVFATPAQAADALNKLHAHVYKGSLLSVALKKRIDNLAKPTVTSREGQNAVPAPSHASRLIVRNIPFNATEQDIRATFLPYGPIHSINIPMDDTHISDSLLGRNNSTTRNPRTKGFAFVWMLSKSDAESAIEGCNGTVLRAGIAQSLVSDKQKKKKERRLEAKIVKVAAINKEEGGGEDEDDRVDGGRREEVEKSTERIIAVDWALSKDRWEKERAKMEDVERHSSSESDTTSDSGSETDEELGIHDGESEGHSSESDEEEEDNEEEKVKPLLPPPETGTTVFIRNIPFDATEDELRTLFRSFGPLRYARITKDPASGRSRGSGFACFWNKVDADRAVRQSELLQAETAPQTTVNPFSLPSILTPDPSSSLAQNLVLHGRTLDVVMAVTRDVAGKLKEDNEKARQKLDKRNMYLLREGVILPNSPSAETLTPAEVEKRTSSFNARRALLKSNPSLYISKTRLSVRQIPTFVTERMLKRLALHSIKAFNAEVKQGKRDPLDADEMDDRASSMPHADAENGVGPDHALRKGKRFKGKESAIKQSKIVRQAERVDPITGKGKSKGYGFVEMYKHSDALKFLRWANNNPEVAVLCSGQWWKEELESLLKADKVKDEKSRDEKRIQRLREEIEKIDDADDGPKKKIKGTLIVEFSIENVQVVQRRNAKQKDSKAGNGVHSPNEKRKRAVETDVQLDDSGNFESRSTKRRRTSPAKLEQSRFQSEDEEMPHKEKPANSTLGSIIGRKRKERRKGKRTQ